MRMKLREAVSRLVREIEDGMLVEVSSKSERDRTKALLSTVKTDLAEPIRNCDRFSNSKDAYDEFRNVCYKTSCKECRYREYKTTCFVLWLFDDWAGDEALK